MASSSDILDLLPHLEKGGATVLLVGVLIWLIKEFLKRLNEQDEAHRTERDKQDEKHHAAMKVLMESHSKERTDWVSKIEAAADKHAKATAEQGDRLARALTDALRGPRP